MIDTIIFDLGNVLIDWNPRHLYKQVFENEAEMNYFLENVCTAQWNEQQDAGRSLKEATDILITRFPDHATNIRYYYERWEEMLGGEIAGTVQILKNLKNTRQYKLYALTNWSGETFSIAREKFEFLSWFDGIVVSGIEKDIKPNPAFYHVLLKRFSITPRKALFIDDKVENIQGAENVGLNTIHFTSPEKLKQELEEKRVLV